MSNQEQLRAKSALQSIFLSIQSTSSERASADAETDSSGSEVAPESAASVSGFDAYLNSLHLTAAAEASATASAKSDLTAFAERCRCRAARKIETAKCLEHYFQISPYCTTSIANHYLFTLHAGIR